MVFQFKVWKIQWENRGPRTNRRVLCMRDRKGRLKKVAKTEDDQRKLRKWYEGYNIIERLETLIANRKLKAHITKIKEKVRARGFTHQMSLYGVFINPNNHKREYRRYEIFKAGKWLPDEVGFFHDYFLKHVPENKAGVFVFHNGKLFVDEEDTITKMIKIEVPAVLPDLGIDEDLLEANQNKLRTVNDIG
jgi:hypothetical protein